MRLWHNDLIHVLPRNQLLGQWRELNSIYKLENRHILINFVYDYPKSHLYYYSKYIIEEMVDRNYRLNLTNHNNYFLEDYTGKVLRLSEVYPEKMNQRYLIQCLYNLEEKYQCGGITQEEWNKILIPFSPLVK